MNDTDKTQEELIEEITELRQQITRLESLELEYNQLFDDLRHSEVTKDAILRAFPDLMFRLSGDGIHVDFFTPNLNWLFVQPNNFLGKHVAEVLPADTAEKYTNYIRATLDTQQEQHFEYHLDFKDSGRTYYEARMVVFAEDEVLVIVRNITDRKRLESEVQKAEIDRIQFEKEREIIALKEQFVSMVSHEFRTPMTIISTAIHLLSQHPDRLDTDQRTKKFQQIDRQIMHLSELIDKVLTVGRVQSGKMTLKLLPTDIAVSCRSIFDQIQMMDTIEHHYTFTNNVGNLIVMLDSNILEHVLTNLLTNALKYTPANGEIGLAINRNENLVTLQVSDSGIGISDSELQLIFDSFYRASNIGTIQGTGLGLFITKQYVEFHGGTIEVQSELNKGTIFTVSLPIS